MASPLCHDACSVIQARNHRNLIQHRTRWENRDTLNSDLNSQHKDGCQSHSEDVDKWVKNFSDRQLTQAEKDILAKGLNFAVTPRQTLLVELITATESAIRNSNIGATADKSFTLPQQGKAPCKDIYGPLKWDPGNGYRRRLKQLAEDSVTPGRWG